MSSKLKLTNVNGNTAVIENNDTITKDVNIDIASITTAVDTVGDLVALDGSVSTVIVKDSARGGIFNWESTGTSNDGTIFAGSTGVWVRQPLILANSNGKTFSSVISDAGVLTFVEVV